MSKVKQAARAEHKTTEATARAKDTPVVRLLGTASEVADQPPMVALSLATMVGGAVLRRPAVARAGLRMLAAHALATGIKSIVKSRVDRTRPAKALRDGHRVGKGSGADDTDLNSFPSGHTAGAVAVAQAVARDLPGIAAPVRLAALAIAAVQMPRGKHYLSDVLVGAAIGWASEGAVSAAVRLGTDLWRQRREAGVHGSVIEPALPATRGGPDANADLP